MFISYLSKQEFFLVVDATYPLMHLLIDHSQQLSAREMVFVLLKQWFSHCMSI